MPLSSITFVTLFGAPYQRVTREIRRCCGGCEHNKLYWEHDISGMGWNYSVAKSPERSGGHASSTSSYNLFDSGTFFLGQKSIANARLAGTASSSSGALRMQLDSDVGAYWKRCACCVYEAEAEGGDARTEAVMRQAGPGTPARGP